MSTAPPHTNPLHERLVEAVARARPDYDLSVLAADCAAMAASRAQYGVRTSFGIAMRAIANRDAPGALAPVDALLSEALRSPFGLVSTADACAVTTAIGAMCYRDEANVALACKRILRTTIESTADTPIVGTLLRVCDGEWRGFVRDYSHWASLVWTVPAEIERVDLRGGFVQITFASLASLYLSPGFWAGIMPAFGLADPSAEVIERGSDWGTLALTWTPD